MEDTEGTGQRVPAVQYKYSKNITACTVKKYKYKQEPSKLHQ